ncbi:NAD(+) diphosphatase [Actinokineospora enzanensis]|uniref:NAD(+) diphosphatase n=1 Tax=Actinokineospora enzanensis TaxID=155975 RepID=UPI0003699DD6|nr:NAD(+) diphosphatase [Actinokineospora enzanensis]
MTPKFQLPSLPTLSRSTTTRSEATRKAPDLLDHLWKSGHLLLIDPKGRTPVTRDLSSLALRETTGDRPDNAWLLGELDDISYWAQPIDVELAQLPAPATSFTFWSGAQSATGEQWHDLRGIGAHLDGIHAGIFTAAAGLSNWHARARFCARCGSPTTVTSAGWATTCTGCSREEYPRTDPAVICLVHDTEGPNGEHVLLATGANWPAGRYSVLAGFVETGESLEACVEREIAEEVGVQVRDVRYLGSQPWPFPRSIMIGFAATADRDAPITPADGEIDTARWMSRTEVREILDHGGRHNDIVLAGGASIARLMIESWASGATTRTPG